MATGAATEQKLGKLHDKLADLFLKVLKGYELRTEVLDRIASADDMEDELMEELFSANIEPSPAMLSAVAKFLKDNEISVDRAELDQLSAQQERLKARKARRPNLQTITNLKVVGED